MFIVTRFNCASTGTAEGLRRPDLQRGIGIRSCETRNTRCYSGWMHSSVVHRRFRWAQVLSVWPARPRCANAIKC